MRVSGFKFVFSLSVCHHHENYVWGTGKCQKEVFPVEGGNLSWVHLGWDLIQHKCATPLAVSEKSHLSV